MLLLIKNGIHITVLHLLSLFFIDEYFLTTTIFLKLYTTNYFYWFGNYYDYFKNKKLNFIKQFVKFTDFGHVASAICYFYPPFLPVAHNIHFVITSVYWIARFVFNVQDCSDIIHPEIIQSYSDFWSFQGHSIPYILILDKLKNENYYFNNYTLLCSYVWMYFWIIFIYYPWRTLTKDPVYTNLKEKIPYFGFFVIHLFFILANELGKIIFNKIDKVCLN